MAWTTPKTWRDNEDRANAANLNTYVRDNQLALRADHASLAQRVAALEAAGFSASVFRDITWVASNRAVLTDLTPPAGTVKIYLAFRRTTYAAWTQGVLVDYALWSSFPEVETGDALSDSSNSIEFVGRDRLDWRVGRGVGNVLAFAVGSAQTLNTFDRVEVSWFS